MPSENPPIELGQRWKTNPRTRTSLPEGWCLCSRVLRTVEHCESGDWWTECVVCGHNKKFCEDTILQLMHYIGPDLSIGDRVITNSDSGLVRGMREQPATVITLEEYREGLKDRSLGKPSAEQVLLLFDQAVDDGVWGPRAHVLLHLSHVRILAPSLEREYTFYGERS